MSETVLTTRLTIPAPRPDRVRRARLHACLEASLHHRLTLVSAPAGFGKTTAVSDWLHARAVPAAWLTLDAADNDPPHFLRYLAAALKHIVPNLDADIDGALHAGSADYNALLADLINATAALDTPAVLVLDDYHHTDSAAIDHLLDRLLTYQPIVDPFVKTPNWSLVPPVWFCMRTKRLTHGWQVGGRLPSDSRLP